MRSRGSRPRILGPADLQWMRRACHGAWLRSGSFATLCDYWSVGHEALMVTCSAVTQGFQYLRHPHPTGELYDAT